MLDSTVSDCKTISLWLQNKIAGINKVATSEISENIPLSDYGLDSLQAVSLTGDLGEWLKIDVDPTLIWDYPTIQSLSEFLSQELCVEKIV